MRSQLEGKRSDHFLPYSPQWPLRSDTISVVDWSIATSNKRVQVDSVQYKH